VNVISPVDGIHLLKLYMQSHRTLRAAGKILYGQPFHLIEKARCCQWIGYYPCQIVPRQAIDGWRHSSSASSTRWKSRQGRDSFAREAKVQGLKSRAAFKLLEVGILSCFYVFQSAPNMSQIDAKYKLFKKGQTIVDLV
jgi:hypothetical protein